RVLRWWFGGGAAGHAGHCHRRDSSRRDPTPSGAATWPDPRAGAEGPVHAATPRPRIAGMTSPDGYPYPAHWEADVVLRDGSTMHIRPIRPSDADALQEFHRSQSPQSIYFRFFAPMERLSDSDLRRFTTVDHQQRVALVLVQRVEGRDRIVAVGRFDRLTEDGDVAEVAFNVSDAAQGKGLGSILLEHLAAAGRELGVRRFVAEVLPSNARMIRVFRDAGYEMSQTFADGVVEVSMPIRPT